MVNIFSAQHFKSEQDRIEYQEPGDISVLVQLKSDMIYGNLWFMIYGLWESLVVNIPSTQYLKRDQIRKCHIHLNYQTTFPPPITCLRGKNM